MKRSHESHAEKSVRRKTEKLLQCTREIEKDLATLDHEHRKAKKGAREESDGRKADFLRQAAALRRRVDECATEQQRQRDVIAQLGPELKELHQRMRDVLEQQRERRDLLDGQRKEQLQALRDEIGILES